MNPFTVAAAISWILIVLGAAILFIAAIILLFRVLVRRRVKRIRGGGLIMLGPIPIIFGTDKETIRMLMIMAIMLMVIMLVLVLVSVFLLRALR